MSPFTICNDLPADPPLEYMAVYKQSSSPWAAYFFSALRRCSMKP